MDIVRRGLTVSFKFNGEFDGVDAVNFSKAIIDYSNLIKSASADAMPGIEVNTVIKSVDDGCLDAMLGVVVSLGQLLAGSSVEVVSLLNSSVQLALSGLKLRQELSERGGAKEAKQQGDSVNISTGDGSTVITTINQYNFCSDPIAQKSMRRMVEAVDQCEGVTGMRVSVPDAKDDPFVMERGEFSGFEDANLPPLTSDLEEVCDRTLFLISPVYEKNRREWQFSDLNGLNFLAKMDDQEFLDRVIARDPTVDCGPGSIYHVRMRSVARRGPKGIQTASTVEHVYSTKPASDERTLPID